MSRIVDNIMANKHAEIARLCAEAGEAAAAPEMIESGRDLWELKPELERRRDIRAAVAEARKRNVCIGAGLAGKLIKAGASVAEANEEIAQLLVSLSAAGRQPALGGDHGWGAAIAKAFGPRDARLEGGSPSPSCVVRVTEGGAIGDLD